MEKTLEVYNKYCNFKDIIIDKKIDSLGETGNRSNTTPFISSNLRFLQNIAIGSKGLSQFFGKFKSSDIFGIISFEWFAINGSRIRYFGGLSKTQESSYENNN